MTECLLYHTCVLQAGRGHVKQLLSDLECSQATMNSVKGQLSKSELALSAARTAKEVAEARLASLNAQLSKSTDAAAEAVTKSESLQAILQVRSFPRMTLSTTCL